MLEQKIPDFLYMLNGVCTGGNQPEKTVIVDSSVITQFHYRSSRNVISVLVKITIRKSENQTASFRMPFNESML